MRTPAGIVTLSIIAIIYLQAYVYSLETQRSLNQAPAEGYNITTPSPYSSPTSHPTSVVEQIIPCQFKHSKPILLYESDCKRSIECQIGDKWFLFSNAGKCNALQKEYTMLTRARIAKYNEEVKRINELRKQIANQNNNYSLAPIQLSPTHLEEFIQWKKDFDANTQSYYQNLSRESQEQFLDANENLKKVGNVNYEALRAQDIAFKAKLDQQIIDLCIGLVKDKYKDVQLYDPSRNKGIIEQYQIEIDACSALR